MKVGMAMTALIAVLGAAVTLTALKPDTSEQDAIASVQKNIEIYKNKKMPSEAVTEYQKLFRYEQFSNDYEKWNEYKTYCYDNGFADEFIAAGRKMLSLNSEEVQPAREILEWYKDNDPDSVYSWIALLRNNLSPELYAEFGEYYDTIKGGYFIEAAGYKELGDWSAASFGKTGKEAYLMGINRDGKPCVIAANGKEIIKNGFERIYSYSYNEKLIAADNDDQIVYTNSANTRKRVPYDYSSDELLKHSYLGPYCNGVANYCGADDKWGFLNSRADIIASGYDYATPGSDGYFAVKNSGGKWSVLYQNSSGGLEKLQDTDYDDIKTDEYGYMMKKGVFFGAAGGAWYLNRVFVDSKGQYNIETPDVSFEDAGVFGELGAVKISGQWGFVDDAGNIVIEPQFDDAKSFSCGFAAVKKNGEWGYIDKSGKVIIDYSFSEAGSFSNYGVAAVKQDDSWDLIKLNEYEASGGIY